MKKRIPLLLVLAALVAAGLYFYPRMKEKPAPANQLVVSGNIEAHESLVSFKVSGRVTDLPIQEGQWVEAGTVLAKLDNADYRQKVGIDEANVHVRESNLALTKAGSREQDIKAAEQSVAVPLGVLSDLVALGVDVPKAWEQVHSLAAAHGPDTDFLALRDRASAPNTKQPPGPVQPKLVPSANSPP